MEGISTSGQLSVPARLPGVGRGVRRRRPGHRGAHRTELAGGNRPGALALADVHGQHRRCLPGGLFHDAVTGAVAAVELPPAPAWNRVVWRSDHLLDHAGRDAQDDRASPLRSGGRIHLRQYRFRVPCGVSRHCPGSSGAGAVMIWLGVVLAGGVGAVLRVLGDRAVAPRAARSLPFGTLAVNISGAALLGLLGSLALSRHVALIADTAFVGSYTTFSTWMLETQRLSEERQVRNAVANIVVSIVLGIGAALFGQWIAGRL